MELAELLLLLSAILFAQGGQEIERRLGLGRIRWIGGQALDFEMALALLDGDGSRAQVLLVEIEFDAAEIERIEMQLQGVSSQGRIDLVEVVLKRDGGVAAHLALFAPQEGQAQSFGIDRAHLIETGRVTFERGLLGLPTPDRPLGEEQNEWLPRPVLHLLWAQ